VGHASLQTAPTTSPWTSLGPETGADTATLCPCVGLGNSLTQLQFSLLALTDANTMTIMKGLTQPGGYIIAVSVSRTAPYHEYSTTRVVNHPSSSYISPTFSSTIPFLRNHFTRIVTSTRIARDLVLPSKLLSTMAEASSKYILEDPPLEIKLERAADFVKRVFLLFREATWVQNVGEVEVNADEVLVHDCPPDGNHSLFTPFPNHSIHNESVKAAVLTQNMCNDAYLVVAELFEQLVQGMHSKSP